MTDEPSQPEPTAAPNNAQESPEEKSTPSTEATSPSPSRHASHSPLVFANYPPLWSKDGKSKPPKPQQPESEKQAGASVSTLKSILSTKSKEDRRPRQQFNERDPSNNHQYLQQPDRSYTHPRLNVFGRDIGSMGKPPSLFGGGSRSLKKKK